MPLSRMANLWAGFACRKSARWVYVGLCLADVLNSIISLSMFGYVWSNIRDLVMLYKLSLRWLRIHNRDSFESRFSEMGL